MLASPLYLAAPPLPFHSSTSSSLLKPLAAKRGGPTATAIVPGGRSPIGVCREQLQEEPSSAKDSGGGPVPSSFPGPLDNLCPSREGGRDTRLRHREMWPLFHLLSPAKPGFLASVILQPQVTQAEHLEVVVMGIFPLPVPRSISWGWGGGDGRSGEVLLSMEGKEQSD